MPKVLISDKMSPKAEAIFKENGLEVDVITGLEPEKLKEIIGKYDGLAIRSATKVTKDIIEAAKNLKVIARAGIGVDNVDIPEATNKGIIVMNTPFGNSVTTAEHAIAMMFAAARQIPLANQSTHQGLWEKSRFMGVELTAKTLGLIGCGNIGGIVAKKALGLGMKVISYDPFLTEERAENLGVEKVELDDLLKRADFITLHVPLNSATKNIISADNMKKMKKGAYLINCARGGLVDEKALKENLDSGHIAGAALDVFEVEPAKENILFNNEKVVMTPHLGAATKEAQENVAVQVAEQISNFLKQGIIENSLNIPPVSPEDAKFLQPFINLGQNLGSFVSQITENPIKEVKISYQGEVTKFNTKPITANIVKNILTHIASGVNIVNSQKIASDLGISIQDTVSNDKSNYNSLIKIIVTTEKQTRSIAGSIFAGQPRIVEVNEVRLEASTHPNLIFIKNEDKPGLIGNIGDLLGKNKINIANFHLGRKDGDDSGAIALIATDQKIEDGIIAEISNMPSVIQAKFLHF